MSISFAFFTFLNSWFVALFLAFPFSVAEEGSEEAMEYKAAPRKIHWRRLFTIATLIATGFTLFLALVIKSGIFQL